MRDISVFSGYRTGTVSMHLLEPTSVFELSECFFRPTPKNGYHLLGHGWNTLLRRPSFGADYGFVSLAKIDHTIRRDSNTLEVGASLSLRSACLASAKMGLSGLEWLWDIPSSLGGAIAMNAGAYGAQMSDVVETVDVYDWATGSLNSMSNDEMNFGVRNSRILGGSEIVLRARLALSRVEPAKIWNRLREIGIRRRGHFPYDRPNCGSVFVREQDAEPISKVIDRLGLKGARIGGAEVSTKHAGFIINNGGATGEEIWQLITLLSTEIHNEIGRRPRIEQRVVG